MVFSFLRLALQLLEHPPLQDNKRLASFERSSMQTLLIFRLPCMEEYKLTSRGIERNRSFSKILCQYLGKRSVYPVLWRMKGKRRACPRKTICLPIVSSIGIVIENRWRRRRRRMRIDRESVKNSRGSRKERRSRESSSSVVVRVSVVVSARLVVFLFRELVCSAAQISKPSKTVSQTSKRVCSFLRNFFLSTSAKQRRRRRRRRWETRDVCHRFPRDSTKRRDSPGLGEHHNRQRRFQRPLWTCRPNTGG